MDYQIVFSTTDLEAQEAKRRTLALHALSNAKLSTTPGALAELLDVAALEEKIITHQNTQSYQRINDWAEDFLFEGAYLSIENRIPTVWVTTQASIKAEPADLDRVMEMVSLLKGAGFPSISFQRGLSGLGRSLYAGMLLEDPAKVTLHYFSRIEGMNLREDRREEGAFAEMWKEFLNTNEDNFPLSPLR